ncbi:MAG: type II CRISPR RNA-guided endonuclease Cas9, partial [Lachnospiraceae bacterium]|nr:type II CRISPR RNA-guided endonuclease Cas9 [Lachnospiraceae bacterium]
GKFNEQELKRICGFKFDGWGRLSRSFLEMEGDSTEDGVRRTFIGALWETNDNHMELLSSRYTYSERLEKMTKTAEKPLSEWVIEDLNDMYLSAPVKRMVWQTLSVVKELEEVLGHSPERIFVEMAREEGEKNKRTVSRKQKLMDLYKSLGKEGKEWCEKIEKVEEVEFKNRKLYLYYLQKGQCMYTGQTIDLHTLLTSNTMYDIDHIYPQHYLKDDSLENNLVLALKDYNNNVKKDIVPLPLETRNKRKEFWKLLKEKDFITEEKYNRLTRSTMFTNEELAGFINRQLVETRQGTKVITQILKQAFPKTEIVFNKAGIVSDFRHKYDLIKVRCVNNHHHAHDAYLNIVVGNTYFTKFTRNPLNFMKEAERHPEKDMYKYHMDKIFDWDVKRNEQFAWVAAGKGKEGTIKTVKAMLDKNSPLVTRYCAEYHGGITRKVTIYGKDVAKEGAYIPAKMSDVRMKDVTKYGGLTNVAVSGYSLIEYKVKGKTVRSLESVPVFMGRISSISEEELITYFSKIIQAENPKNEVSDVRVCYKFIPSDALIKYNGFYYYLGGKTNDSIYVKCAVSITFDRKKMNYIKKIEKAINSGYFDEKDVNGNKLISHDNNISLFEDIVEKYKTKIFKNQIGVLKSIIVNGNNMFYKLDEKEQCYVLMQLINNIYSNTMADVRLIGGKEKSGIIKINKKIIDTEELILIHQSVTGLYQAEVNLLTV